MEKYFIFLYILKEIDATNRGNVLESQFLKLLLLLKFDQYIINFNFVQEGDNTAVSTVSSLYIVQKVYQHLSEIS